MKPARTLCVAIVGALGALGSCGGPSRPVVDSGPSAPDCTTLFSPCGGSPVGAWKSITACPQVNFNPLCTNISEDISRETWTILYKDDNTFSWSKGGDITDTFPAACVMANGQPITCDKLLQMEGQSYTSCTSTGNGGCRCAQPHAATTPLSGTWTKTGNQLDMMGVDQQLPYCVGDGYMEVAFKDVNMVFQKL